MKHSGNHPARFYRANFTSQLLMTTLLVVLAASLLSCGGGGQGGSSSQSNTPPLSARFSHVFIVLEENQDYSSVVGNSSMPYLNGLADTYGLATQYYASFHPSIGNYFMLTTGQAVTTDDSFTGTVTDDNVVRRLLAAGKTWKAYEEDLPSPAYTSPDVANYTRRHCPLSFFSDVVNDPVQIKNLVPFTQLAADLANDAVPSYAFITPNLCNDAHDCSLSTADTWLQKNIDPLLHNAEFQQSGLLIIVFDESASDNTNGGGHVAWVAVSPQFSKAGYKSSTLYRHQDTLRLMMEGLGLTSFPGKAQAASNMSEFFK